MKKFIMAIHPTNHGFKAEIKAETEYGAIQKASKEYNVSPNKCKVIFSEEC